MSYQNYTQWKTTPLTAEPLLSIIIPTYNEEVRIIPTIGAIASYVCGLGFDWELIVADDGSQDQTLTLVQGLGFANLRLLEAERNGGKGSAVRRGMLAARGQYLLFADADNSTPVEELSNLLAKVKDDGYDIAIGSRSAEGAEVAHKSAFRHILSGGLNFIVRNFFNIKVKDTQCGFKLYRREAAQRLHEAQTLMGFSFDLEILYLADKFDYRVAEVPVHWFDAPGSKVDTRKEAQRFIRDLVKIKVTDWRGKYPERERAAVDGMRVAMVTTHPPGTGSLNEYAYHFVRCLKDKPEVGELTLLVDELPDGAVYPSMEGVDIRPIWRFNSPLNALRILRAVRKVKPDVVLFNSQFSSFGGKKVPGALGLFSPMLLKRMGFPTVVLLHNIMETVDLENAGFGSNPIMERLIRGVGNVVTRAILSADYVALTIPKYVEILQEKYKADNVLLAPHGSFEELTIPPSFDLPDGPMKVMTFGKFGTYKKLEGLVEAFKLLKNNGHSDLGLVVAGSDSPNAPDYIANIQKQYADVPDIEYTGYVAEEDVPRIFGEAALVVFPYTSTTGSSGVLHQAGDYGKAVVLPNIGDFAEVITEEGYTGEFFEPDDPQALAAAMVRVLDDPEYRIALGQQNYAASRGIPIDSIVDWYLLHMQTLLN